MKKANKYNARKVIVDNILFDSEMESRFYAYLMRLKGEGVVKEFSLQPAFVLLEGFTKHGKKHLPIKYVGDFEVWYSDGSHYVYDVKGMELSDFKLKKKLYASRYDVELKLVTYSKIDGGWIELDDLKKARKLRKKAKEAAAK